MFVANGKCIRSAHNHTLKLCRIAKPMPRNKSKKTLRRLGAVSWKIGHSMVDSRCTALWIHNQPAPMTVHFLFSSDKHKPNVSRQLRLPCVDWLGTPVSTPWHVTCLIMSPPDIILRHSYTCSWCARFQFRTENKWEFCVWACFK